MQHSHELDNNMADIYNNTKIELEELLQEKTKGIIFRTKCNWYELGEVNSAYFYNMEKRRYNSRVCSKLIAENGQEETDPQKILTMQKDYYTKLYTKDPEIEFTLTNTSGIVITDQDREKNEMHFTKQEIGMALKGLKSGKTPGPDGLPPEFLKMFFAKLGDPLYDMITEVYDDNYMPENISTGILNLIPKASKDSRFLHHLRPISILGSDYKVIEKAIANRLEPSLKEIINADQRGFMKSRRISTNIRKIFDIMCFLRGEGIRRYNSQFGFCKMLR